MQRREQHGGRVSYSTVNGRVVVEPAAPLRGRGHFGVDGSVARQVAREVESIETRTREASWLSTTLSRGLSGTRIA